MRNIQLFLLISVIPPCEFVINTIAQDIKRTTTVLNAVARFEFTPSIPIFAKIEVKAAKTADSNAKINHIIFHPKATSNAIISEKPNVNIIIPLSQCLPVLISGTSSLSTTYIIAPAAKERRYGKTGIISAESKIVRSPATGSTMPDSIPLKNALPLLIPLAANGMEIIAPSGRFCIAIPIANTNAAENAALSQVASAFA